MNLSKYWANSIGWQEDSSGGPSQKGSTTQWGHELSEPDREYNSYSHSYGPIEPETNYEVTITVESSTEAALERFLGCVLIGIMPDEGLEETILSLYDILEFYSRKPLLHPARLAPTSIDATIVDKRKRPDLVIG